MSRQVGVGRSRFQPFAAPVIAEPLQDCVAPKAQFTVSPPQDGFAVANLGQPRKLSGLKARLTFGLSTKSCMNRAFSACPVGASNSWAIPHASTENSAFG